MQQSQYLFESMTILLIKQSFVNTAIIMFELLKTSETIKHADCGNHNNNNNPYGVSRLFALKNIWRLSRGG